MVTQTESALRPIGRSTGDRTAGVMDASPEVEDAVESVENAMPLTGWRYACSDRTFHCYAEGEERSLCGAHLLGRHGASASGDDVPKEIKCPFCLAMMNRT